MKARLATVCGLASLLLIAFRADAAPHRVHDLKITVLSTMLTDAAGIGEWGFAALVEVEGQRILFDTGARPETVLQNARELGVTLDGITDVVISHNHGDHTGGLATMRKKLMSQNRSALSRIHIARGAFWSRPSKNGGEDNQLLSDRAAIEATGAHFIEHDGPAQIVPGVWLTGPVPRPNPERNWSPLGKVVSPAGPVEDTVPEDQSLIFDTDAGLVLLSGCGHAGVVNTVEYARKIVRAAPLYAAIGGFHLFPLDDARLGWTISRLRELGLANLLGAHCTGIEAIYRIRAGAGLSRKQCLVGSVGSTFTLSGNTGQIDPLRLAR
jgi:7,8-dihydropterin-6-yl-methyl-4-(beta-D-ribofuranosyl)aminobenzene 5'-phosphate synthase